MKNSHNKDNNENKHTTTKLIICIIIIIIIILLLITSCTSSFWGTIGNIFGSSTVKIDPDTNDKRERINTKLVFTEQERSITLDDSSYKLTYTYEDILTDDVVCTTSDAEIATCVAYDGYVVVNPKRTGNVTIYATTTSNDIIYKATSELSITAGIKGIKMNSTSGTIILANTNKKNVAYRLVGIKGKVNVKVDDESIATATAKNGILSIKGLKEGQTKITLSVQYGGKTYTSEYQITINKDIETTTRKENTTKESSNKPLKLNISFKQLYVGEKYQINVTSGKVTKWESTNKKVVTVSKKGKITAKSVGNADINAYDKNGNKVTVRVTVVSKPKKSKLELSTSYKVLRVGETFTPTVIKGKVSRWKSSNSKIAKVNKKTGKITAIKPGIITITASDFWYFGNKATITIEVVSKDTPINPVDPSNPTNPTKPINPGDTTTTTTTTSSTSSSSSSNPTNPTGSTNPTNPSNPTTPSKPTKPTDPTKPADIIVAETRLDMHPGEKYTLTVQGKVIGYVSNNPTVASVDKKGQITAKNAGVATITITGANGEKKEVTVYVTNKVSSDDIVIPETRVYMKVGDKHRIIITRGKAVKFESSKTNVATVDTNGVITATGVGTSVITVTGQNNETRQITVVVTSNQVIIEPNSPVEFMDSIKSLTVGDIYTPTVKGTPKRFESSDPTIAEVDSKTGKILAKSAGTVTITVFDDKGNQDTMTVIVNNPPVDNNVYLELANATVDLIVGDTEKILITKGTPTKYESSNSNIVEVDKWGRIKGKNIGSAIIKVTGVYGEVRELVVNVLSDIVPPNPDKELILKETDKTMTIGDIVSINSLINQGSFTNASSDKTDIIEIVNGKIVAKHVGNATVTINGKLNSQKINIKVVAEQIILSRPSINMIIGEKQTVTIEQGAQQQIKWESSNPAIATVDPVSGEITAVSEGEVIIYAINESGEKTPLIVNVSKSNNTKLEKLQVYINNNEVPISIGEGVTSYYVPVEADINLNQYSVVATPISGASVKYKYPDGRIEGSLNNLELKPLENKVQVIVTAQDGTTTTTYDVIIYKKLSTETKLTVSTKKEDGSVAVLETEKIYPVPYLKDSIDLNAIPIDSRSSIKEVKIGEKKLTIDANGNFNAPLAPGDNTIYITVEPQDKNATTTYAYKIHRAVRTIEFERLEDNEFYIEDSPITLNYVVKEESIGISNYSLSDITIDKGTFNGSVRIDEDIITLIPTKDDIKDTEHTLELSYKNGESKDSISFKVKKYDYDITGPESINTLYNDPDSLEFELKFDTKILKYENNGTEGDTELFKRESGNGVFKLISTTGDGGVITVNYPSDIISDVTLADSSVSDATTKPTATYSHILKFKMNKPNTLKNGPKVINITIGGQIYGFDVAPLNVSVTIRQKHILTLKTSNEGEYLNSFRNTLLTFPVDLGEDGRGVLFDLNGIDPFKVATENPCLVYTFVNWVDENGNDVTLTADGKVLVDRNMTLTPKFSESPVDGDAPTSGYLTLKSFDLFDADTLYGGNKLIYPGLEGSHVFTIENDTASDITINKILMHEETICSRGACLNMGYKVRRTIPESKIDKYYYGSSSSSESDADKSYTILNKDVGTGWKEIEVPNKEFVIKAHESAELTILWKWVDDNDNDYKIGEEANNNNSYKFYSGLEFTKTNPTCSVKSN